MLPGSCGCLSLLQRTLLLLWPLLRALLRWLLLALLLLLLLRAPDL